ncbi:MAG: tetratricopeptide repeat protein [Fidelibacterota bacterium]
MVVLFVLVSRSWARDFSFMGYPDEERGPVSRAFTWLDRYFRSLEFREPIVTMPVEGRYGIGLYGWRGGNPFLFDSTLISYEGDPTDILGEIAPLGRTVSFVELQGLQTNLSYLLFKKSYVDILTGLGFRYSSVFSFPSISITKQQTVKGLPEVPSSWPDTSKSFSPTLVEGNIVTSVILQWRPKWFLHLQYSYGMNWARFYRDDAIHPDPSGTGRTATYALGIKFLRESESAARYAWGFELRHVYQRVGTVRDPGDSTPISAFDLPNLGIFFTFGAFYGGRSTVGDEGKALFLKKDYVSAKRKLGQFVNSYPHHARIRRARKLLKLSAQRIPYQLVQEGERLELQGNLDMAVDKLIQAKLSADPDFRGTVDKIIDRIAEKYVARAEGLFAEREYDLALKALRKAGSVSETAKKTGRVLEGRVYLEQGRDLAFRGLYSMALGKYDQAMESAPSLRVEIRRAQLEAAAGMLEDVNEASDEGSVRLALHSLYRARKILGGTDGKMDRIIAGLEDQLSRLDQGRIRNRVEEYVEQAQAKLARKDRPRVITGMLVAEVEDILGKPDRVVGRTDDRDRNVQLWIYDLPDGGKTLFYFEDYVLFKIERE